MRRGVARDVDWGSAMASKRRRPDPRWVIILEDVRSQNRATIEAVEASREALERRLDRVDAESRSRDASLELLIRDLRMDVRELKGTVQQNGVEIRELKVHVQQNSIEVHDLAGKVTALARLEERVAALERHGA